MTDILAWDAGFGNVKGRFKDKTTIFPSMVGKTARSGATDDMDLTSKRDLIDALDICIYQAPNLPKRIRRFVGRRAIMDSGITFHTLGNNRYSFTDTLPLLETSIALSFYNLKEYPKQLTIVTGLPIAHYNDENKKAIEDMLIGKHKIELMGEHAKPKLPNKTFEFEIKKVLTLYQPYGSWVNQVRDDKGSISKAGAEFAPQTTAIIDIGTNSSDILIMREMKPSPTLSFSLLSGMAKVYEGVADTIMSQSPSAPIIPIAKLMVSDMSSFDIDGKSYDLSDVFKENVNYVANEIIAAIATRLRNEHQISKFILAGGGGALMFPQFQDHFGEEAVMLCADPQFSNVNGYYKEGMSRFVKDATKTVPTTEEE